MVHDREQTASAPGRATTGRARPEVRAPAGGAAPVLALQRAIGNRAVARTIEQAPARRIQRRLRLGGESRDVQALLGLLGRPAGLSLGWNERSLEVSILDVAPAPDVASPDLRAHVAQLIVGERADAYVGHGLKAVGAFPRQFRLPAALAETMPLAQALDVDQLLAIELDEPGAGAAIAIHELVENAAAQRQGRERPAYEPAHRAGMRAESEVASQLVAPGDRVAESAGLVDEVAVEAFDYSEYFLVLVSLPAARGGENAMLLRSTGLRARKVRRVEVARATVDFADGSDALPAAAGDAVASFRAKVAAERLATVRVEGQARADEARRNPALAEQRAAGVHELLDPGDDDGPDALGHRAYRATRTGDGAAARVRLVADRPADDWRDLLPGPSRQRSASAGSAVPRRTVGEVLV